MLHKIDKTRTKQRINKCKQYTTKICESFESLNDMMFMNAHDHC